LVACPINQVPDSPGTLSAPCTWGEPSIKTEFKAAAAAQEKSKSKADQKEKDSSKSDRKEGEAAAAAAAAAATKSKDDKHEGVKDKEKKEEKRREDEGSSWPAELQGLKQYAGQVRVCMCAGGNDIKRCGWQPAVKSGIPWPYCQLASCIKQAGMQWASEGEHCLCWSPPLQVLNLLSTYGSLPVDRLRNMLSLSLGPGGKRWVVIAAVATWSHGDLDVGLT
jgi:hypothetical protein